MLPVPGDAHILVPFAATVADEFVIGVGIIPGMRGADRGPCCIVKVNTLGVVTSPLKNFQVELKL